jgi:hypothetical protein
MLVSGQRKTGFTALCPELEGARGARLCPLADRFEVYEDPVWLVAGLERIAMSTDPTAQQNQTAVALQGGQAQVRTTWSHPLSPILECNAGWDVSWSFQIA